MENTSLETKDDNSPILQKLRGLLSKFDDEALESFFLEPKYRSSKTFHLMKEHSYRDFKFLVWNEAKYGSFVNAGAILDDMLEQFESEKMILASDEDRMNDAKESIARALNAMIRYAPYASRAQQYFDRVDSYTDRDYTCLIFSYLIDNKDGCNDELVLQLFSEAERKGLTNGVTRSVMSFCELYNRKQKACKKPSLVLPPQKDSEMSSSMSFSSVCTDLINLDLTDHAKTRMKERGIEENDIKMCLKYGTKVLSSGLTKSTNGKLIVISQPSIRQESLKESSYDSQIITTYNFLPKERLGKYLEADKTRRGQHYTDLIITTALYHNFGQALEELSELKKYYDNRGSSLTAAEKDNLSDLYTILTGLAAPTYEVVCELLEDVFKFELRLNQDLLFGLVGEKPPAKELVSVQPKVFQQAKVTAKTQPQISGSEPVKNSRWSFIDQPQLPRRRFQNQTTEEVTQSPEPLDSNKPKGWNRKPKANHKKMGVVE